MIERFKDLPVRKSAIIYQSALEQIKKMYAMDPVLAGELAISAIELVLVGEISSDNPMIEICLEQLKIIAQRDHENHDAKAENGKNQKMISQKLDQIAKLYLAGLSQAAIGKEIGVSQQTISSRMNIIRKEYPELLQEDTSKNACKIGTSSTSNVQGNTSKMLVDSSTSKNNTLQGKMLVQDGTNCTNGEDCTSKNNQNTSKNNILQDSQVVQSCTSENVVLQDEMLVKNGQNIQNQDKNADFTSKNGFYNLYKDNVNDNVNVNVNKSMNGIEANASSTHSSSGASPFFKF